MTYDNNTNPAVKTQETQVNTVEFIYPADGVYFNETIGEWEVVHNGDAVAWAGTQQKGWDIYHEMLHAEREHFERCPEDYVLWTVQGQTEVLYV